MQLGYFRNTKGQRDFISTLAFIASHEARRRMAVFSIQLARSHTRPASRGTCRATAVKSRPSLMSFECSRALWARCGVQGHCPCRGGLGEESGGNVRPVAERFQSAMLICTAPARPQRAVRGAGLSPAGGRP